MGRRRQLTIFYFRLSIDPIFDSHTDGGAASKDQRRGRHMHVSNTK